MGSGTRSVAGEWVGMLPPLVAKGSFRSPASFDGWGWIHQ